MINGKLGNAHLRELQQVGAKNRPGNKSNVVGDLRRSNAMPDVPRG